MNDPRSLALLEDQQERTALRAQTFAEIAEILEQQATG